MDYEEAIIICTGLLEDLREFPKMKRDSRKVDNMLRWIEKNRFCTTKMAASLGKIRAKIDQLL